MTWFSLGEWWSALDTLQQVFWLMGAAGTSILVIQTALSLIGLDFEADVDLDIDTEISMDFSMFSFKSIMAFITFFGWMGVVGTGRGWSIPVVLLAAFGCGLVAMFLVAYLLFQFQKLESSGNMRIEEAYLAEGSVYLAIPAASSGAGQVTLELSGNVRELSAMTKGDVIPTGAKVRVIDILEDNTLLVEQLPALEEGNTSDYFETN